MTWTAAQTPDLSGKHFVITGGNSGIGLECAAQLLAAGGQVTLACRNPDKAAAAEGELAVRVPGAQVATVALDLSDLASVATAVQTLRSRGERIHGLLNNAGIMAIPRMETQDGFEMQLGTNHLGHFALTLGLLDLIDDRVVNVSSQAHRGGRLHRDDLMLTRRYNRWAAYGQSKLANLLFTFGLHRRLKAAGVHRKVLACHPGYSATNLQGASARLTQSSLKERWWDFANGVAAQSAEKGAWPTTYAASMPAKSGTYWGPAGLGELWGPVTRVRCSKAAWDTDNQDWLWNESERLTGYTWEAAVAALQA